MKTIHESLSYISNVGVFCDTFTKTDNSNLLIQKNIVSNSIVISGGVNKIGYSYPFDMEYVVHALNVNLENTTTYRGNIYYTNGTFGVGFINKDFSNKKVDFISSDIMDNIKEYSKYLSNLPQTGTKRQQSSTYTFTANSSISIINILDADIVKLNSSDILKFVGNNSKIILNIKSVNPISLINKTFEFSNITNNEVLINIVSPTVNISGEIGCTIFAPNSNIFLNAANINGQLFGHNITSSGSSSIYYEPILNGFNTLPILKLIRPTINATSNNNRVATISITNNNHDLGEIYYSINNSEFTQYSSVIDFYEIGDHKIEAYVSGYGYIDSDINRISFNVYCECTTPKIILDNNTLRFDNDDLDVIVYYTLDGTYPSKESSNSTIGQIIPLHYDGEYDVVAFNSNNKCIDSSIISKKIYNELPETKVLIYFNEENVTSNATYAGDIDGTIVRFETIPSNLQVKYTLDGTNPMKYGINYDGIPFNIFGGKVKAVVYSPNFGFSDIAESPTIVLSKTVFIDKSEVANKLPEKNLEYEPYAVFSQDMGWYGPLVLSDDTAIYQALVNILSTSLMEIPFRPTLGTSIKDKLFELSPQINSDEIISTLKREIESNDPRIDIDRKLSYAYYDDGGNSLIVYIEWLSKISGDKGRVKYNYSLDGIL